MHYWWKFAKFVNEIQAANEDFIEYFKSMGDKHSELISHAIGINEQYGWLLVYFSQSIMYYKIMIHIFNLGNS